jgi:hypothetical protein
VIILREARKAEVILISRPRCTIRKITGREAQAAAGKEKNKSSNRKRKLKRKGEFSHAT